MIALNNQETVVRFNKSSSINPTQSGETESRVRAINTALVLSVMQGGYFKIYWCDEFRCGGKSNSSNELAALLAA